MTPEQFAELERASKAFDPDALPFWQMAEAFATGERIAVLEFTARGVIVHRQHGPIRERQP
jgi:hypothetical protein